MHIGILTLHLAIEQADSLKDKRQVIKSLKQHLRNKFNVSVAEVEDLDVWRRATLGVAVVANEPKFVNQVLNKVIEHVEDDFRVVLGDYGMEIQQSDSAGEIVEYEDADDLFADALSSESSSTTVP